MRVLFLALGVALLSSCAPPEGRFACTTDEACPLGWSCVTGHCYSSRGRPDAGADATMEERDAPSCGDGTCALPEDRTTCPADCG